MWIAKIKALKRGAKITYRDIAAACEVSWSKVSSWFNGEAMPETEYIDIMYNKFFSEVCAIDIFERYFHFAYEEKHNVDGQIDMCAVNEEPTETKDWLTIERMVGIFSSELPWKYLKLLINNFDNYLVDSNGGIDASSLTNDDWDIILSGLFNLTQYQKYYNRALLTLCRLGYYKFEEDQ